MAIRQARPRRKATGKRYVDYRKKKLCELGSSPSLTKIDDNLKVHIIRGRGSNCKKKLLRANYANVFDPLAKKYAKTKIKTVLESPANIYYIRRNIMVRGTIIDTGLGKAKVTSRPGQDGTVNAVLIK
ncbi:MAG: 30S ribosomal protein S8e [Candidatus Woesearchaeota archaeon]|nr:30S ribosomal protein S8e [Candidatus Woesearchaeota archaeon]